MGEIRNTHIGEIQQLVFNIDGTKEDPQGGLAELVGDVYKWHHKYWQGSGEMLHNISWHDKLYFINIYMYIYVIQNPLSPKSSLILYYTEICRL